MKIIQAAPVRVDSKISNMYRDFQIAIEKCDEAFVLFGEESALLDHQKYRGHVGNQLVRMANLLFEGLSDHIQQDRVTPKKDLKKIEMATRSFLKMRRVPTKPGTWWTKYKKHALNLYNTRVYPLRDDTDEAMTFELEGFTVFNTIQAEGSEMDSIRQVIEKSVKLIKNSKIPGINRILYGQLNVVGKIREAKLLAWYFLDKDTLSIRTRLPQGYDAVHSVIHELGHRWWAKFLDKMAKTRWVMHHDAVGRRKSSRNFPKVGEPLGFRVKKYTEEPIVTSISRGRSGLKFYLNGSTSRHITEKNMKMQLSVMEFPTKYSSTSHEEHFCESFALYCLGMLSEDHTEAFEKHILGKKSVEDLPGVLTEDLNPQDGAKLILSEIKDELSNERKLEVHEPIGVHGSIVGITLMIHKKSKNDSFSYTLSVDIDLKKKVYLLSTYPAMLDNNLERVPLQFSLDDDVMVIAAKILSLLRGYEKEYSEMFDL